MQLSTAWQTSWMHTLVQVLPHSVAVNGALLAALALGLPRAARHMRKRCCVPCPAGLPAMCAATPCPFCAAASLEQQEPLAAAGVPEERRQFEVTVANILQAGAGLAVTINRTLLVGLAAVSPPFVATGNEALPDDPSCISWLPLQGPLVALAPRLAAYTKPGGLLGLSGVCRSG